MREIKFRVWDGNNKVFHYPCVLELDAGLDYQQYTGFKDVNGVEIYEGDILEDTSPTIEVRQVVTLDANSSDFIFDQFGYKDFRELIARGRLEVIGNIYEQEGSQC